MNDKKICFIMCINNEQYFEEALYYLNRLNIPDGYEMDLLTVSDAASMTSGYNEAMQSSDAKYKVYMHQDVFVIERDFISKILDVFSDLQIGLLGMVGCVDLPKNAIQWNGRLIGALISNSIKRSSYEVVSEKQSDVITVDGFLMVTQYDISWREDVFDGWDFYDCSQSFEFRKAGYRVVVPFQEKPWVIHYDGILNLKNYWHYRKVFLRCYNGELTPFIDHVLSDPNNPKSEEYALSQELIEATWQKESAPLINDFFKKLDIYISTNDAVGFLKLMEDPELYQKFYNTPKYAFAKLIYTAVVMEREAGLSETILDRGDNIEDLISNIINPIRFYLWRIEFALDEEAKYGLLNLVNDKKLSFQFLSLMVSTTSVCDDPLSK